MKDSNENINLSQNDLEENKQKTLNSSKLLVSHLSTIIIKIVICIIYQHILP